MESRISGNQGEELVCDYGKQLDPPDWMKTRRVSQTDWEEPSAVSQTDWEEPSAVSQTDRQPTTVSQTDQEPTTEGSLDVGDTSITPGGTAIQDNDPQQATSTCQQCDSEKLCGVCRGICVSTSASSCSQIFQKES